MNYALCTENSAAECNGRCSGSCSNSPLAAEAVSDNAVSVLWKYATCKWPGCDADCANSTIFLRSSHYPGCVIVLPELASCFIYAKPCGSHFVDILHPFRCSFGCVLLWTGCFENNVPFDSTAQIYLINLHWKLGLGFKLRLRVALF